MDSLNPAAVAGATTFVVALAVDLSTKVSAVVLLDPRHVYYNHANPSENIRRLVMSAVAIRSVLRN